MRVTEPSPLPLLAEDVISGLPGDEQGTRSHGRVSALAAGIPSPSSIPSTVGFDELQTWKTTFLLKDGPECWVILCGTIPFELP